RLRLWRRRDSFFFLFPSKHLLLVSSQSPLLAGLNLSLTNQGPNARQRFLLLSHLLDGIDFAQRQLEIQAKQRLFQARRFAMPIVVRQVPILVNLFPSLHGSLRSGFKFQVPSFKLSLTSCRLT